MRKGGYVAAVTMDRPTKEQRDLIRRRTEPFLDQFGVDRPLTHLLAEAYIQGMRDAAEVMEIKNARDNGTDQSPAAGSIARDVGDDAEGHT